MSTVFLSLVLSSCTGDESTEPPDLPVPVTPPTEPVEPVADDFDAAAKYQTLCAPCHGTEGKGDGPAGAALNPEPASFADPAFWAERDDAQVRKAIKEGGASVGKSPIMAPFGNNFESDGQIDQLVSHLKTFRSE